MSLITSHVHSSAVVMFVMNSPSQNTTITQSHVTYMDLFTEFETVVIYYFHSKISFIYRKFIETEFNTPVVKI